MNYSETKTLTRESFFNLHPYIQKTPCGAGFLDNKVKKQFRVDFCSIQGSYTKF